MTGSLRPRRSVDYKAAKIGSNTPLWLKSKSARAAQESSPPKEVQLNEAEQDKMAGTRGVQPKTVGGKESRKQQLDGTGEPRGQKKAEKKPRKGAEYPAATEEKLDSAQTKGQKVDNKDGPGMNAPDEQRTTNKRKVPMERPAANEGTNKRARGARTLEVPPEAGPEPERARPDAHPGNGKQIEEKSKANVGTSRAGAKGKLAGNRKSSPPNPGTIPPDSGKEEKRPNRKSAPPNPSQKATAGEIDGVAQCKGEIPGKRGRASKDAGLSLVNKQVGGTVAGEGDIPDEQAPPAGKRSTRQSERGVGKTGPEPVTAAVVSEKITGLDDTEKTKAKGMGAKNVIGRAQQASKGVDHGQDGSAGDTEPQDTLVAEGPGKSGTTSADGRGLPGGLKGTAGHQGKATVASRTIAKSKATGAEGVSIGQGCPGGPSSALVGGEGSGVTGRSKKKVSVQHCALVDEGPSSTDKQAGAENVHPEVGTNAANGPEGTGGVGVGHSTRDQVNETEGAKGTPSTSGQQPNGVKTSKPAAGQSKQTTRTVGHEGGQGGTGVTDPSPPLAGFSTGELDKLTFMELQAKYIELHAMYRRLKDKKVQDLEGLLHEQDEYVVAMGNSAKGLVEHWKKEAEKQMELAQSGKMKELQDEVDGLKASNLALQAQLVDMEILCVEREAEILGLKHRLAPDPARLAHAAVQVEVQSNTKGTDPPSKTDLPPSPASSLSPVSPTVMPRTVAMQFPSPPVPSPGIGCQFPSPSALPAPSPGVGLQFPTPGPAVLPSWPLAKALQFPTPQPNPQVVPTDQETPHALQMSIAVGTDESEDGSPVEGLVTDRPPSSLQKGLPPPDKPHRPKTQVAKSLCPEGYDLSEDFSTFRALTPPAGPQPPASSTVSFPTCGGSSPSTVGPPGGATESGSGTTAKAPLQGANLLSPTNDSSHGSPVFRAQGPLLAPGPTPHRAPAGNRSAMNVAQSLMFSPLPSAKGGRGQGLMAPPAPRMSPSGPSLGKTETGSKKPPVPHTGSPHVENHVLVQLTMTAVQDAMEEAVPQEGGDGIATQPELLPHTSKGDHTSMDVDGPLQADAEGSGHCPPAAMAQDGDGNGKELAGADSVPVAEVGAVPGAMDSVGGVSQTGSFQMGSPHGRAAPGLQVSPTGAGSASKPLRQQQCSPLSSGTLTPTYPPHQHPLQFLLDFQATPVQDGAFLYCHPGTGFTFQLGPAKANETPLGVEGLDDVEQVSFEPKRLGTAKEVLPAFLQGAITFAASQKMCFMQKVMEALSKVKVEPTSVVEA